jgi:hypothetical protein
VANSTIGIDEPTTIDKKLDTESLTVGANTVERERVQVTGAAATEVARVQASAPAGTEMALVTRNIPSGTQPVSAAALPLPTGAATETTLAAAAAALAAPLAVTGTFWQATQPVSGPLTDAQLRAAVVPVRTDPTSVTTLYAAGNTAAIDAGGALKVDGSAVTQPVSVAGSVAVTGPLTDAQLRAVAVPVSGSFYQATQPVSAASLPLPTGAATEASLAAVKTAVETLDNAIAGTEMQVDVVAALPAGTNHLGNVGHGKTLKSVTGSASATATLVAAVASKKIKVYSLSLMTTSTTAVTVTFKSGAAGTALATYLLQAPTGVVAGIAEGVAVPSSLFETAAGALLEMAFSAAQSVTYNIRYWDDD